MSQPPPLPDRSEPAPPGVGHMMRGRGGPGPGRGGRGQMMRGGPGPGRGQMMRGGPGDAHRGQMGMRGRGSLAPNTSPRGVPPPLRGNGPNTPVLSRSISEIQMQSRTRASTTPAPVSHQTPPRPGGSIPPPIAAIPPPISPRGPPQNLPPPPVHSNLPPPPSSISIPPLSLQTPPPLSLSGGAGPAFNIPTSSPGASPGASPRGPQSSRASPSSGSPKVLPKSARLLGTATPTGGSPAPGRNSPTPSAAKNQAKKKNKFFGSTKKKVMDIPAGELQQTLLELHDQRDLVLSTAQFMRNERDNIVKEIYTSEISYLSSLHHLVLMVMERCAERFKDAEMQVLFSNIPSIRLIHVMLADRLHKRLSEWNETQCIGDIFLELVAGFKSYTNYCINHEAANHFLLEVGAKKKISEFFQKLKDDCDDQSFQSLLIMPIQRVPRYRLLLQELLKATPKEHPDFANIQTALEKVKVVASEINTGVRGAERKKAFDEAKSTIAGVEEIGAGVNRSFLMFGKLKVTLLDQRLQELDSYSHVVLFDNLLVIAGPPPVDKKEKSKQKHVQPVAREQIQVHLVWIDTDMLSVPQKYQQNTCFKILTPEVMYICQTETVLERDSWIETLKNTTSNFLDSRDMTVVREGLEFRRFHHFFSFGSFEGSTYEGEWLSAKPEGRGKFVDSSGQVYEGYLKDGRKSGTGKMIFATGDVYDGEWQKGLPHGKGSLSIKSPPSCFLGSFYLGKKHGKGLLKYGISDPGMLARSAPPPLPPSKSRSNGTLPILSPRVETGIPGGGPDETVLLAVKENRKVDPFYDGNFAHDVPHGQGVYQFADGSKYNGEWESGRRHGKGIYWCCNGDVYRGSWEKDCMSGAGTMCYANGDSYEGEWKEGRRHGKGKFIHIDETSVDAWEYEGEWDDGYRDGQGSLVHSSGLRYSGGWKRSMYHGNGKLIYPNGDVYEGGFAEGRREGSGSFAEHTGAKYDGTWHASMRFGEGTQMYASAISSLTKLPSTYKGKWLKDRPDGHGQMIYANGDNYEGTFSNGRRHGRGVFRNLQQTIKYDGEWQHGVRQGQGVLEDDHGLYRGEFEEDLPHGKGLWKRKSGETYEGNFVRGQPHGTMTYTSADGRVVSTVEFSNGIRQEVVDWGVSQAVERVFVPYIAPPHHPLF
mmetsp:Transcript_16124/g.41395  ORF Transcript_16124/g.41395 Transcript_16124/m.41395 type:complete len:1154 (-) Transcript_16124:92-3553(-)